MACHMFVCQNTRNMFLSSSSGAAHPFAAFFAGTCASKRTCSAARRPFVADLTVTEPPEQIKTIK